MNIIKTIKKWFSKKTEPSFAIENTDVQLSSLDLIKAINGRKKFWCHYCGKTFVIEPEKITTKEVQLLYTERFVTGKAYACPYCNEINIIG
jgi:hypothetical protein